MEDSRDRAGGFSVPFGGETPQPGAPQFCDALPQRALRAGGLWCCGSGTTSGGVVAVATGLAFSFASADLPDKRGPGDATRPVDAPAARAPSPASWGGGVGDSRGSGEVPGPLQGRSGVFPDAPAVVLCTSSLLCSAHACISLWHS